MQLTGPIDVGVVSDEILLRLGSPDSAASAFWTPWLAEVEDADEVAALRAGADALLIELGVLDRDTGELFGPLAQVAEVVASSTLVLTFESERGDGSVRGALVCAQGAALLDLQDTEAGGHALVLLPPRNAVAWLVALLDPAGAAGADGDTTIVTADALADVVPAEPASVVRAVRVATEDGESEQHLVTVLAGEDRVVFCAARPDDTFVVRDLGPSAVDEVAIALLGGAPAAAVS